MDDFIKQTIELTIKQTTNAMMQALGRNGMLKSGDHTSFQKTETLLYNYMNFKKSIDERFEEIEIIRSEGIPQRSNGITSFTSNIQVDRRCEIEKVEDRIEKIQAHISHTKEYITTIENALEKISDDLYYDVITLKYFDGKSREEIAEIMQVDVSTITRNKNRLINLLKITLFSDEVIYEMFGVI